MKQNKLYKHVLCALFMALTCVATLAIHIPSPMEGYVNLGDCIVLLSGWIFGPVYGFLAGGIGSALADLLLGYGHYVPGTLIIKGLMAVIAALIYRALSKKTKWSEVIGGVLAEIWMVGGYFIYASLLLGKGLAAASSIPGNLVQGAVGLVAGVLLIQILRRTHALDKWFDFQ